MQILVATRPITARVGYIAFYKIEFVLLLESVHNACKFEMLIILVNHSKVCVKKNIDDRDLPEALVFPKLNVTLHPLRFRHCINNKRSGRSLHNKLCIMWRVFDDDGHQRGQTSRPVIGTEILTNCNFEAHVYHYSYHLGFLQCRCFMLFHTNRHTLLARPHGAFQSQCYITKFK